MRENPKKALYDVCHNTAKKFLFWEQRGKSNRTGTDEQAKCGGGSC